MMTASICTLLEGHFHYGLGALGNSLYAVGFRGTLWAGYRGALPPWASAAVAEGDGHTYTVAPEFVIRFLPLTTERHLTNYKPEFMLDLWERHDPGAEQLFYLDPDILVKASWSFFTEWAACGVALCEDLNSPVNPTHPLRLRWQQFFAPRGFDLSAAYREYVNGGFIGLRREHRAFLEEWVRVQEIVAAETDGMRGMNLGDRTFLFQKTDQDALNITLYSTGVPVSILGQEGMDFIPGGYTLSHAVGKDKPWRKGMLLSALRGVPPKAADKAYWQHVEQPIRLFEHGTIQRRRLEMKVAAALGRFMRRGQ